MTVASVRPSPEQGRWSMRQARAHTSVADRSARRLVARGTLPSSDLTHAQVIALQAQSQLEGLPAAPGFAPLRDQDLTSVISRAWSTPAVSIYGLADASSVKTADVSNEADPALRSIALQTARPYLLLPLGLWIDELVAAVVSQGAGQ